MAAYSWPETDSVAVDESLCYHARQFCKANEKYQPDKLKPVLMTLEETYAPTKVIWSGWPKDFRKFVLDTVEWQSSPGWPWKSHYPTNKDLFLFDGVNVDPVRVAMVEDAVKRRWNELLEGPKADPIFLFVKPEPHKQSKVSKRSWRLISGVGLTDTLIDRILYGSWLDKCIEKWQEIPSKAGWAPQRGGYGWMSRCFRGKQPMCIDKSAWDWTVQEWHVELIEKLVPRMHFGITDDWRTVFANRMGALYRAGNPVLKTACGCEFVQLVTGIQKSGTLGTIGFNCIWQFADHLAVGGAADDVFFALGDDTAQEVVGNVEQYLRDLEATGSLIKEVDFGFPLKFGGHEMSEGGCKPAYRQKHAYELRHLDKKNAFQTLESYRHLYALDDEFSRWLEQTCLNMFGPENLLSREYLRDWYIALE